MKEVSELAKNLVITVVVVSVVSIVLAYVGFAIGATLGFMASAVLGVEAEIIANIFAWALEAFGLVVTVQQYAQRKL